MSSLLLGLSIGAIILIAILYYLVFRPYWVLNWNKKKKHWECFKSGEWGKKGDNGVSSEHRKR
jgi:hypothetical protein